MALIHVLEISPFLFFSLPLLLSLLSHIGGSNFRVLLVTVKDGKIYNIDQQTKVKIDDATKTGTQEMLFGFIAQSLIDFIKQHNITEKLPLGFTFSFPVHQTSLISGTLIHWTKNFDAKGAVNEDVVQLLMEALKKKGVGHHLAMMMIN